MTSNLIIQCEIFDNNNFLLAAESSITSQLAVDEVRSKINIICLNFPFVLAGFRNSKSYDNDYMCLRDLFKMTEQQIWLVVSASTGKNIIPLIHNYRFLESVYVFCDSTSNDDVLLWSKDYHKIRGVFGELRAIENKMDEDSRSFSTLGSFDTKQLLHALYMQNLPAENTSDDIYMTYVSCLDYIAEELPVVTRLDDKQRDFVSFHMMIETLLDMPSLPDCKTEMMLACEQLCGGDYQVFDAIKTILINYSATNLMQHLTSGSLPLSQLIQRLYKEDFSMKMMLSLQQLLMNIQKAIETLSPRVSSFTAYCVQTIGSNEIALSKGKSHNELFSMRSYFMASTCIVTARTIARQAKAKHYQAAILEIEVSERCAKTVYSVDANRVLFKFGAIFRLCSVDLAPDGVWHIHLKCVTDEQSLIKEQLQLQIGERLTWLTFGNYLFALQKHREASDYYEYLLDHLNRDNPARSSIYNNMSVMLSLKQTDTKHRLYYFEALDLVGQSDSTNGSDIVDRKTSIDCSPLGQTLNIYKEALACSTDSCSCNLYRETISSILKKM